MQRVVKNDAVGSLFVPVLGMAMGLGTLYPKLALAETPEEKGLKIAIQLDKFNEGFKSESSDVKMELINAHGDVVKRKMTMEILEGKNDGDKSLSVFSWPADVNGTKLLTWTHKKRDDDQWLYLPALKRIKRISSRNKSGSFMGSEFAYEDLASQEVEKYRYRFLKEEKFKDRDCWKMERFPVDKRSGYKRQVVWSDKGYMNPVKIEYFDRKNELLKHALFKGYKKYGKYWRFGEIEMSNVQTKKRSVLRWENRKLGAEVDEEDFTADALED